MERFMLKGRVALVTGGGRGIGAACAAMLAEAGASVALLDLDAASAEAQAAALRQAGARALGFACDVTDAAALERAVARVIAELGGLQVLVNNAGGAVRVPATEVALEDWRKVIELNLTAVFSCARIAARHMLAHGGGAIVNIASIMGLSGGIYPNASYQASKGGVVNLTRALALEWASQGVRVNAVAPTFVRTALTDAVFSDPARSAAVMANTPLGALPEPEDIAAAVLYLASPAARCVTGIVLPVDSGYLAR
jgi:NAD(P)-dependent dehydrogenase (short-subunit alcohol dehydrogenase family)